ncbi:hypothetical protein BDA96_02G048200 [Sorghum bicolor]|uniref:Uncharacterized protein n=1 Tax=Sorghum bicolor TaxID=4558 RepID=A0A921RMN3_SORBI|nr:hypothetical protein BDA96_02G048200 [Sorghum bicolor]
MPTLDRRLLSWSDSDTEDGGGGQQGYTPTSSSSWRLAVDDDGSYDDRCSAPAFVDDVLVPPREEGADDDGRGVTVSGTRKACAAAGFVAVGCLCAYYLAWRCRTTS